MLTRDNTPGRIEGHAYSEVFDCNWVKCWAVEDYTEGAPYLVLLPNGELWVVPGGQPLNMWGSVTGPEPKAKPNTSTFTGPFDDFDVAFATFQLLAAQA